MTVYYICTHFLAHFLSSHRLKLLVDASKGFFFLSKLYRQEMQFYAWSYTAL